METRDTSSNDVWTPCPGSWEEVVYTYEEQCANFRFTPTCKNDNRPMNRQHDEHAEDNKRVASM